MDDEKMPKGYESLDWVQGFDPTGAIVVFIATFGGLAFIFLLIWLFGR